MYIEEFTKWVDKLEIDSQNGTYRNPFNIELFFEANADENWEQYEELENRVAFLIEDFMSQ